MRLLSSLTSRSSRSPSVDGNQEILLESAPKPLGSNPHPYRISARWSTGRLVREAECAAVQTTSVTTSWSRPARRRTNTLLYVRVVIDPALIRARRTPVLEKTDVAILSVVGAVC